MVRKPLPVEFKEFITLLNKHKVKYLLLGGWAVSYYGNPRSTKDIDFLVLVDKPNLFRLHKVLLEFKAPPINLDILNQNKGYIYFGSPPLRIEVISHADGITINDCYTRRNIVEIDGVKVNMISKADLIINKKATNRLYDHADAEILSTFLFNPKIQTKEVLKAKLILANIKSAYKNQLDTEKFAIKKLSNKKNYKTDLSILKKTIFLYNKALKSKEFPELFALHKSFKINPLTNRIYTTFTYKLLRKKIYNEIEYRYKLLLKIEYSYLINSIKHSKTHISKK